MKRYLIEIESVRIHEPESETAPSNSTHGPKYKVVYRIVDTATRRMVPPESEDIDVVASTCTELNAAEEKAKLGASRNDAQESSLMADQLPTDIVQAIAISNAKTIDEQPAILANLALAQQIFNQNMQQQIANSHQQAMNQIKIAVIAKYVTLIDSVDSNDQATLEKVGTNIEKLVRQLERIIDGKAGDHSSQQAS